MKLLGTAASNKALKAWLNVLVYPTAPFFLTNEMKSQLPNYVHMSSAEFCATFRDLSFHDSYSTYDVKPEGAWVMLLNRQQLQSLPDKLRLELLYLQASLGRGQLYNFDDYKNLINYPAASGRGIHQNLATFAKGSFALILNLFEASLGEFHPQRLNPLCSRASLLVGAPL